MTAGRRLLYFGSFVCLAATAALAAGHVCLTSIASLMVVSAIAASLGGAPGLVNWRAWPLVFLLLPLGAYFLARAQVPPPADISGPGGQIGYLLDKVDTGVALYQSDSFPLEVAGKPELRLVLSLAVYLAIFLAAFSALSRRCAVVGIAMLIPLLGFGLTVDDIDKAVVLAVAFVVFSGCLLVTSLSLERGRRKPGGLLPGAAVGLGAALVALVVVGVTPVAAGRPWMRWETIGEVPNLTFEWKDNDQGLPDPQTGTTVMRVKSPVASYWRANALDSFDGVTWSNGEATLDNSSPLSRSGLSPYELPPDDPEPPGRLVSETFSVESISTDCLFVGGSPRSVSIDSPVPLRLTGERALIAESPLGPKLTYTVTAWIPAVTPADLEASGPIYPIDVLEEYTALPFPSLAELPSSAPEDAWIATVGGTPVMEEWSGLYKLNREIVGAPADPGDPAGPGAPADPDEPADPSDPAGPGAPAGPYEVTLAIRDYLRANYAYSLEPPATDGRSPYAAFLFETKTGYCKHFAGAMATLLRFNGIPARVALGFACGERGRGGAFVVSGNDGHAWVEVYFSGLGWLPFDPTPGRTAPGGSDPSPSPSPSDAVLPGSPSPSPSASPSPRSTSPSPRTPAKEPDTTDRTGGQAGKGAGENDWLIPAALSGAVIVVLVAWPTVRVLRRRRALRRGDCETRLRTAVEHLYLELADWDIETPGSQTLDETALFLRESLDIDAEDVVGRLQAVLYGGRAATQADIADLAALRRAIGRRLREERGRTQAILALYGMAGWTFRLPVAGRDATAPSTADT